MNLTAKEILEKVKACDIWVSEYGTCYGVPADASQVFMECLSNPEVALIVYEGCRYAFVPYKSEYAIVNKEFMKELLEDSIEDTGSFAHFVNECMSIKTLRKVPPKFSVKRYASDEILQACVDCLLECSYDFRPWWQLGLVLRGSTFHFIDITWW